MCCCFSAPRTPDTQYTLHQFYFDKVNSYVSGSTKQRHPSGLAHVKSLNLNEPSLTGNTGQGHVTYTHHDPPLLELAHFTLENKTCWAYKGIPTSEPILPCPHIASSNALYTSLLSQILRHSASLLVRHCTPKSMDYFPLNKEHQTCYYIVLSFDKLNDLLGD